MLSQFLIRYLFNCMYKIHGFYCHYLVLVCHRQCTSSFIKLKVDIVLNLQITCLFLVKMLLYINAVGLLGLIGMHQQMVGYTNGPEQILCSFWKRRLVSSVVPQQNFHNITGNATHLDWTESSVLEVQYVVDNTLVIWFITKFCCSTHLHTLE